MILRVKNFICQSFNHINGSQWSILSKLNSFRFQSELLLGNNVTKYIRITYGPYDMVHKDFVYHTKGSSIRISQYLQRSKINRTRSECKCCWSPVQFWSMLWKRSSPWNWKYHESQRKCLQFEGRTSRGLYQVIFWTLLWMSSCQWPFHSVAKIII